MTTMETLINIYYYWRENPALFKEVCTSPQIIFSATALISIGRRLIKNAKSHRAEHDHPVMGKCLHKIGSSRKNYTRRF